MATTTVLQNVNYPGCKKLVLRVVFARNERYSTGGETIDVSNYMRKKIYSASVQNAGGSYTRPYRAEMLVTDADAPSTGLKLYLQTAGVDAYTDPYAGYVGEVSAELENDAHLENLAFDISVEGY